ncbi:MAG: hypothetical protein JWP52_44 [Rhizobacter sp.]|jgi:hypothetical protein|nr:hypothetical protein [Rhizobacter sp.]
MDHTSDPNAARHEIDPSRTDLALEFRRNTAGPHSEELAKLVHRMRWGPVKGRHVLVVLEPGRRWALAQLPAERGQKVEVHHDLQFDSLDEAEWHVFKLRWKQITGVELKVEDKA